MSDAAIALTTVDQIDAEIAKTKNEIENVHGTPTEVYARIVGYYRAVRNWNAGKTEEFKHRKTFDTEKSDVKGHLPDVDKSSTNSTVVIPSAVPTEPVPADVKVKATKSFKLFFRSTCPNCPPVKDEVAKWNVQNTWFNVDEPAGLAEAIKYGVMSAPTVIVLDGDKEIARCYTAKEVNAAFTQIFS